MTSFCFLLAAFPLTLVWARDFLPYPALVVAPSIVDLGTLLQGERRDFSFQLRNPHQQDVTVDRIETTCPCLEAGDLPWRFSPREEKNVPLILDLAREPGFSGSLLLEVKGKTAQGETVFLCRIQARVAPEGMTR